MEDNEKDIGTLASKQMTLKCTKRRYECDECEYTSNDMKTLKRHLIRKYRENMSYKCEYSGCNVSTLTPGALREHKRVHANEMECECDLCDHRCNLKGTLYNHKKNKHFFTDEVLQEKSQMHKCSWCDLACHDSNNLARHKNTNFDPDGKPFKCNKCPYTASRKDTLKNYKTSKRGDETVRPVLTCDYCDFCVIIQQFQ
jgi:hypothetical protein